MSIPVPHPCFWLALQYFDDGSADGMRLYFEMVAAYHRANGDGAYGDGQL